MKINTKFQIKLILLSSLISLNVIAQKETPLRGVGRDFFKNISKIENPFTLRDPFKSPLKIHTTEKRKTSKSGYTDGNTLVSGERVIWSGISLTDLQIVGVIIGENRRAMVKTGTSDKVEVLKEGALVGADKAILKAILPAGVIFVEKIVNVYGQDEYLETVIPISK